MQPAKIYRNSNPQGIDIIIDDLQTLISNLEYKDINGVNQKWVKEIFGVCEPSQVDKTPYGWNLGEYVSAQPNDYHGAIIFFADRGFKEFRTDNRGLVHNLSIIGWLQEGRIDLQDRGTVLMALIQSIMQGVFNYNQFVYSTDRYFESFQTTRQPNHNVFEGFETHTFLDAYNSCIAFRIDFWAEIPLNCTYIYEQKNPYC